MEAFKGAFPTPEFHKFPANLEMQEGKHSHDPASGCSLPDKPSEM